MLARAFHLGVCICNSLFHVILLLHLICSFPSLIYLILHLVDLIYFIPLTSAKFLVLSCSHLSSCQSSPSHMYMPHPATLAPNRHLVHLICQDVISKIRKTSGPLVGPGVSIFFSGCQPSSHFPFPSECKKPGAFCNRCTIAVQDPLMHRTA